MTDTSIEHIHAFETNESWISLKKAIVCVFKMQASSLRYENIYRTTYMLSSKNYSKKMYDSVITLIRQYIDSLLIETNTIDNYSLINHITNSYNMYNKMVSCINDIFLFINMNYISKRDLDNIIVSGFKLFVSEYLQKLSNLNMLITSTTNQLRDDAIGDISKLHDIISLLDKIGNVTNTNVYEDVFEDTFIENTGIYYTLKQNTFESYSCYEFMVIINKWINFEQKYYNNSLRQNTRTRLDSVLYETLINKNMEKFTNSSTGLKHMLINNMIEQLELFYNLCRLSPTSFKIFCTTIKQYVIDAGFSITNELKTATKPSTTIVINMIDFYDKMRNIIKKSFNDNPQINKHVFDGFRSVINNNIKFIEIFVMYIDLVLKYKIEKSEEKILEKFADFINIVHLIQDKDIFIDIYRSMMGRRILKSQWSEDLERQFITELKLNFGANYTYKLENMFTDIKTSKELVVKYNKYDSSDGFTPMVLTCNRWSFISFTPTHPFIANNFQKFKNFYSLIHNKRTLKWSGDDCAAEITARFGSKKYILKTSFYQMCILLLFNDTDTMTFNEILESISINKNIVMLHLVSMATSKCRIFTKSTKGAVIKHDTVFTINEKFKSKMRSVKIPIISARSFKKTDDTVKHLSKERGYTIDATIVRIMKSRKTLDYQSLMAEIIKQISLFKPEIRIIKKSIENLIEREYLERNATNSNQLTYLA
jgi:cullin 3